MLSLSDVDELASLSHWTLADVRANHQAAGAAALRSPCAEPRPSRAESGRQVPCSTDLQRYPSSAYMKPASGTVRHAGKGRRLGKKKLQERITVLLKDLRRVQLYIDL